MRKKDKYVVATLLLGSFVISLNAQELSIENRYSNIYEEIRELQKELEKPTPLELIYNDLNDINENLQRAKEAYDWTEKVDKNKELYITIAKIRQLEKENEFLEKLNTNFSKDKINKNEILISKYKKEMKNEKDK